MVAIKKHESRPFLVDLDAGEGLHLCKIVHADGRDAYSRVVGFNFTGNWMSVPIQGLDVFTGPPRFTQCRHIPWIIYSHTSYERALKAVQAHGHPKSRVHRWTLALMVPKMIWTTEKHPRRKKRDGISI